jgi:hypothetical protein
MNMHSRNDAHVLMNAFIELHDAMLRHLTTTLINTYPDLHTELSPMLTDFLDASDQLWRVIDHEDEIQPTTTTAKPNRKRRPNIVEPCADNLHQTDEASTRHPL